MTQAKGIYSIAISARATLNLHSLNNEGGEGNQTQTRMVNVIGEDGNMHSVNAISGDMFKHIQAEHLHRLAVAERLPLSEGARTFNANRVNIDLDAGNDLGQRISAASGDPRKLDVILQSCAITDMEGILITAGGQSLPRKSVVEFGWVVGVPDKVETDTFLHVKYASDRSVSARASATTESGREANIGQALFHRPASSGIYAVVVNLELARIGFNDIAQTYAITQVERAKRAKVLLESVLYAFIEPAGAMRSTQNPHVMNVEGVISVSRDIVPAPCLSPLSGSFAANVEKIRDSVNTLRPNAIETIRFDSMGDFAKQMAHLIEGITTYELTLI